MVDKNSLYFSFFPVYLQKKNNSKQYNPALIRWYDNLSAKQ